MLKNEMCEGRIHVILAFNPTIGTGVATQGPQYQTVRGLPSLFNIMLKYEQCTGGIYVLLALNPKPLSVCTLPGVFCTFLFSGPLHTPFFEY